MEAVPPPFLPRLVENKKLKFGGEAVVRTTGASVPSHVSVRRRLSKLLPKIRSFMIKVWLKESARSARPCLSSCRMRDRR